MISTKRFLELQRAAISEMHRSVNEDERIHPQVGAVIADKSGRIVAKAHRGERAGKHAEYLAIEKAIEEGFSDFENGILFATLEPCTHRGKGKSPCAERVVKAGFGRVFIGVLDPNPDICGHGELYLQEKGIRVEHFSTDHILEIRECNREFLGLHRKSHLPTNSFYASTRISEIIQRKLKERHFDIETLPGDRDFSIYDLLSYVSSVSRRRKSEIEGLLASVRSEAFDEKYATYDASVDARSIRSNWNREVEGILRKQFYLFDFKAKNVLFVGIGNGLEGVNWLEDCRSLVCVDIGSESLASCQKRLPRAALKTCPAEDLQFLADSSQDVYVSLRTYQSAYFGVAEAIREAYRVLVPGGVLVVSVANAYLEDGTLVRGLLPRGTNEIDTDMAHELVAKIRRELSKLKFDGIGVHTGKVEEFVFAKKRK